MRTANPALNSRTFERLQGASPGVTMTVEGTVRKTAFLLLLLLSTATWMWGRVYGAWDPGNSNAWLLGGGVGGLVVAIVTIVRKEWSPVTAPLYALLQGLVLGGISAGLERQFPGVVVQAVALTFGTLLCLLLAYRSGWIRATENFKLGVAAATGAIVLIYLVSFVLSFFGTRIPYIHESGTLGILFSMGVVTIAALNLVLDFDFIEGGATAGIPRYMEWYAAFGLMVTLVWLYLEILRLLTKLSSRR